MNEANIIVMNETNITVMNETNITVMNEANITVMNETNITVKHPWRAKKIRDAYPPASLIQLRTSAKYPVDFLCG
jgi:hypothetical protein